MFGFGKRRGLRHWALYLLVRGPKNGAEIMDAMEAMSQGWWRPSPGSVYPVLEDLAHDGLVQRREDGRYELTERGRDETSFAGGWLGGGSPRGAREVVDELTNYTTYLEDLAKGGRGALGAERERLRRLSQRLLELSR